MRKIAVLSLMICLTTGLAFADHLTEADANQNLSTVPDNNNGAVAQSTTSQLTLSVKANRLIATAVTDRSSSSSDNLQFNWIAPKQSGCSSSTFPIKAGPNPHHDVFWAYRTVIHTSNGKTYSCKGTWSVQVVNTTTGQTLAQKDYSIN